VESRLENFRIHHLSVFYFLEDKSIMITEPKVVNSGVPQGAFLKRQMVLKPDGMSPFMPQDFCVGLDVGIFGRCIRITDCDAYTRQFFEVSKRPSDIYTTGLFIQTLHSPFAVCIFKSDRYSPNFNLEPWLPPARMPKQPR
jgi:hypothetical protein